MSKRKVSKLLRTAKYLTVAAALSSLAIIPRPLPAQAADGGADDDKAIRAQATDYARAFAAADAGALAQMWAADGSFTDAQGRDYKGRAAIEKYFSQSLSSKAAQTLSINIESIKFPAPNVAIEEGTSRIASGPGTGNTGHYVAVHTKNGGKWQMQTVAETNCTAANSANNLKDLDWLVGTWSIKNQPRATHLKTIWSKDKTFLVCQYLSDDKQAPLEELQIIGWDPRGQSIVAWHFGATGGFGCGHLAFDGKSWLETASATEPSGVTGSANYKLTQVDKDNFTWQSFGRVRDGRRLPDSTALTITRDSQNAQ
ncbi:MAG: SgcJ/EcaC family oxidoreductase [Cyanobacteria bacterium SZAS LIN-2]|nr:SgcJ/EcaC family oxidoreductase [Cyanobacteria bacterium SZAS LIN-2]